MKALLLTCATLILTSITTLAQDTLYTEGGYKDGKRHGPWAYNYNGKRTADIVYANDIIITANYYKPDGTPETDKGRIEQLPYFNGGMEALARVCSLAGRYGYGIKCQLFSV